MIPQALPMIQAEQGMAEVVPFDQTGTLQPQPTKGLEQENRELRARNRLLEQLAVALSDKNRYFASQKLDRAATDNEAFEHFVFRGGSAHFDSTHPKG